MYTMVSIGSNLCIVDDTASHKREIHACQGKCRALVDNDCLIGSRWPQLDS